MRMARSMERITMIATIVALDGSMYHTADVTIAGTLLLVFPESVRGDR
jgi:hypothetical protein